MTRCEFCGKSDDDPTETKTMVMNDRLYKCYCVTLEEYKKRGSESDGTVSEKASCD